MSFTIVVSYTSKGYSTPLKINLAPKSASYKATVWGRYACVKLTQTYEMEQDTEKATYKFPIDYNSAFVDLTITTPRETIHGIVQEKEQAKQTFEDGKREGKQVFLTSESTSDPDINVIDMGNLLKNEKIIVEFTYGTELKFDRDMASFYIPLFVTGRYNGFGMEKVDYEVTANIEIHGPIKKMIPSEGMTIEMAPELTTLTYNKPKGVVTTSDIEIKFQTNHGVGCYQFDWEGYIVTTSWFTANINYARENKKVVLVIDCSGSMWQEATRINGVKVAVKHWLNKIIGAGYSFNIITYGNTHHTFSPTMLDSNQENIKEALKYIDNMGNMGGTETTIALKHALTICPTAVLITDGDTSNNDGLHDVCHEFVSLSVMGIGDQINRDNINKMALHGHGKSAFSNGKETVTASLEELMRVSSIPVLSNVETNLMKAIDADEKPVFSLLGGAAVPANNTKINLFTKNPIIPNEFYVFYGVSNHKAAAQSELTFSTQTVDGVFQETLPVVKLPESLSAKELGPIIVKRIIQHNPKVEKEQLLPLALAFHLVTKYTSIVAVGKEIVQVAPDRATKASVDILKILERGQPLSAMSSAPMTYRMESARSTTKEQTQVLYKSVAPTRGSIMPAYDYGPQATAPAPPISDLLGMSSMKMERREEKKEEDDEDLGFDMFDGDNERDDEDVKTSSTNPSIDQLLQHLYPDICLFKTSVLPLIGLSASVLKGIQDPEDQRRVVTTLVIFYLKMHNMSAEANNIIDFIIKNVKNTAFEQFKKMDAAQIRKFLTEEYSVTA